MNEEGTLETQVPEQITGTPQEVWGEPADTGTGEEGAGREAVRGTETTTAERQAARREELTPQQIRESVAAGVRDAQPPAAPRQYTAEELDRMFNVWKPDANMVQAVLNGGEDALKAFVAMRDGLARQWGTLMQYQMEILRNEMVGRMAPVESFAAEQAAAQDRESFFKQNEDLRPYEQLAQTVFYALKAEGFQARDVKEAYQVLADRTRALIGNGAGAAPSGGAPQRTTSGKRPAALTTGSQAGGGGPSAPAAPFPGAEIWFDQ
jgi:hypothetical protein